jgi:DNA-binding response OmpR family regulator
MNQINAPIRTLVVDDDNDMCVLVCKILNKRFGDSLAITITSNVEMAIGMVIANQFELCITDLDMPEINGFKILKMLKQSNALSQTVFLTAHPEENAIKSAFERGAADYLMKPIDSAELCECIHFLANRIRRFRRELQGVENAIAIR